MTQRDASTEAGAGRWLGARLPLPQVARSGDDRIVAGVAGGLGAVLGADATLVRLVFAILALAGGSGIAIYLGAWLLMRSPERPGVPLRPGARMLGLAFTVFGVVLAIRGLGIPDRLLWPAAVAAAGAAIIWRRGRSRWPLVLGVALALAGVALLASFGTGIFAFGGAPFAPGAVAIVLLAVVGPWLWRLARERDAERLERIRTQEREEMAARVHDSVLQTLTLIQRHAGDARRVGALARQQERELRGWLYGDHSADSLVSALSAAATDVEELHGVRIELASSGDCPADGALVLAAREAMTNAAKFAGVDEVAVYVEVTDDEAAVYVRDRGAGFDRASVPADRRGLAESIEARLVRAGGGATVTSTPGEGTEVELTIPRRAS